MPTLFEPAIREAFVTRLAALRPEAPARWGKFTATQMVAHLNESMRMAIGELPVARRRGNLLRHPVVRWLIIHVAPFPRGAPTAPELLARGKADSLQLDAERALYREVQAKFAARQGTPAWPEHPAFGAMTERDWGVLGARHIDHHFRQFGI